MATMSLQAAYDQARSYLEANQVEQAIGVAQHILVYFPENLEAYRILGEAFLAGRQFDQAEQAFQRVLRSDPESIPAHVGLGITYERQGRTVQAVAEFEQALEVRPDMPELRGQLLRLYTDMWGAEGATLRLSRPGLARLYAKGHMLPQAIQEFRGVIDELPDRLDAHVGLAEALWRDGQTEAAVETCETILADQADVLKANLLLGYILLASSDERGERYWHRAEQFDPYQQVARSLFETLPDLPEPDLSVAAWDETAWLERRSREEEEHRAQQPAFVAVPPGPTEQEDFDSWLDQVDAAVTSPDQLASSEQADDFLASLLALDTPPLPAELGGDLDAHSSVTPFKIDELTPAPAEPELEPFSLGDLGLSPEEIAELDLASGVPGEPELEPFSLDDLGLSFEENAASEVAANEPPSLPAEPELEPFSLGDLGLSPEEIAELDLASGVPGEPELEPFSLDDLGLSFEENAASEVASGVPSEPELNPFSLADLGLSPEEIAELEASAADAQASLTPFSLDDLGLSVEEPATTLPTAELERFNWSAEDEEKLQQDNLAAELGDLQPFSLDDLDLNSLGSEDDFGSLPPSLQPFSLDDTPRMPPSEEAGASDLDEASDKGGYSWQQPSAKDRTDFVRADEAEAAQGSIFGRLSQRAAERPPEEPEPLPPVADDDAEMAGYFSNDDVLLRDAEPGSPERLSGSFRLPKEEQLGGEARSSSATEQPAPSPDEPALTPFSLADLGLSAEEIAQLEQAQAADVQASPEPDARDEPALTPFSLADLGLSAEEIAQLEQAQAADAQASSEPDARDEPALTPFSLADLGLSAEEIAQLDAANRGDLPFPATGETIVPGWSQGEEPELTPFSPEEPDPASSELQPLEADTFDFDLFAEMPVADAQATPESRAEVESFSLDEFDFDALLAEGFNEETALDDAVGDIQPFSLDDLGLGDIGDVGEDSRELSVTAEELAGLDLGEFETLIGEPNPTPTMFSDDPAAVLAQLISLGRRQGFVDLTDIISVVSDPEAEADRIEELGWALHNAGVEIRDGDEVIDLDGEDEEQEEPGVEEQATFPVSDAEPELTPFSLADLGLSPDEIATLGLDELAATAPTAELAAAEADASAEPELTPFSLADLGLSPDEIAQLEQAQAAEPAAAEPDTSAEPELTPFSLADLGLSSDEIAMLEQAARAETQTAAETQAEAESTPQPDHADSDDPFDFGLAEVAPVEKVVKRSTPRAEEPPPAVDPDDAVFTPEPLDNLDDIWNMPPVEPESAAPARVVLPSMAERQSVRVPRESSEPLRKRELSRDDERFARRESSSRRERDQARSARPARREDRRASTLPAEFTRFLPTGDTMLDDYLNQLDAEPDNYGLALAIGHLCARTGRSEIMTLAFKRLVRSGQGVEQLVAGLEGLIGDASDPAMRMALARLLGDAYSKQGRFNEAMEAYNSTFEQ